jgi:hypothetical protein
VLILAAVMWGLSVALPVWETRSDYGEWGVVRGALPALIGWLGILVLCPAWLANMLLIPVARKMFKRNGGGFWLSVTAFAIASTAYAMPAVYGDNETDTIVMRMFGFYLWLGSFVVIAIGHAALAEAREPRWVRWAALALMVTSVLLLEWIYPVGVSPLEAALKDPKDMAAVTRVLAQGPPQADKDAALWWAVRQDLWEGQRDASRRLEALIAAGSNVNQADKYGETPLMRAVIHGGHVSLVKLLVQAGADVNARDYRGKTILEIAEEVNIDPQCRQILANAGAHK